MKCCTKCNITKPIDSFYRRTASKDGRKYICIECSKTEGKKRDYKKFYSDYNRAWAIKKKYGLSEEEYNKKLEIGYCQVCNTKDVRLVLDHCHDTKNIRGVLCSSCNTALGLLKDNTDNIESLLKYLKESQIND